VTDIDRRETREHSEDGGAEPVRAPDRPLSLFGGGRPAREMTPDERRASVIRLLAVVAITIAFSVITGALPVVLVIVALIVMIMLHELGHFLTAKWSGMKVTEYFLGFGPRLWSVRKGETEYGVKAVPAGGYVRIIGMSNLEQVDPADEPRTYRQQSFPRRLSVAVAGSTMHFIIAFVLLFVLVTAVGVPATTLRIGEVSPLEGGRQSPAQKAGLKAGDRVVSVDGVKPEDWTAMVRHVQRRPGKEITFVVERDGRPLRLSVVPARENPAGLRVGYVGIASDIESKRVGPVRGLDQSVRGIGNASVLTVKALGSFFAPGKLKSYADQIVGQDGASTKANSDRPVSVVGATRVASQLAEDQRFAELILLLIGINIFVALFNMIPLLPFDGGHVAIAVYERLRSRKGRPYHADVAKLLPLTSAVVVFLVVFGVAVIYLDIISPISLQ
jgi:membrane-associated protease RseP (regulator of RpoE activity)